MRNKYSKEFEQFVIENVSKYTREELRKIVQDKFNIKLSSEALRRYIFSHCKEKWKDYDKEKVRKNIFRCNIGAERSSAGGIFVKIGEPNRWRLKHRLMYEKYHNCKLRDDECIIFLNQNRNDFSKENLKKITFEEFMYLHNCGTFSKNPELTKAGILSAQLRIKANDKLESRTILT